MTNKIFRISMKTRAQFFFFLIVNSGRCYVNRAGRNVNRAGRQAARAGCSTLRNMPSRNTVTLSHRSRNRATCVSVYHAGRPSFTRKRSPMYCSTAFWVDSFSCCACRSMFVTQLQPIYLFIEKYLKHTTNNQSKNADKSYDGKGYFVIK